MAKKTVKKGKKLKSVKSLTVAGSTNWLHPGGRVPTPGGDPIIKL